MSRPLRDDPTGIAAIRMPKVWMESPSPATVAIVRGNSFRQCAMLLQRLRGIPAGEVRASIRVEADDAAMPERHPESEWGRRFRAIVLAAATCLEIPAWIPRLAALADQARRVPAETASGLRLRSCDLAGDRNPRKSRKSPFSLQPSADPFRHRPFAPLQSRRVAPSRGDSGRCRDGLPALVSPIRSMFRRVPKTVRTGNWCPPTSPLGVKCNVFSCGL